MISNPQTPIEKQNAIPYASQKRRRVLWGLISGAVVVIVLLGTVLTLMLLGVFVSPLGSSSGTGTTPQQTATAATGSTSTPGTATVTAQMGGGSISSQQAMTTITQYYTDINANNYQVAYCLWGAAYQQSTSYQQFASGFATTQHDVVQVNAATALSNGTVKVPVHITATVLDAPLVVTNTYQGYYIVGSEQGNVKILSANIQQLTSTYSRVKIAVGAVTLYYSDINAKNYQSAYDMWGMAYRSTTSYQQFVAGFASTQSVSISITYGGVTVLPDGSVKVPLTIHSVNTTSSGGTVQYTYQGYYTVGIEVDSWHLLSASIQQTS